MRILKFRAWDSKNKKFPFVGFHIIGECTAFDLLEQYRIEEYNDLIITQYTGMDDKNGKEIYEGDLVAQGEFTTPTGKEFGQIKYRFGRFFILTNSGLNWDIFSSNCEVFGNIFENADAVKTPEDYAD